MATYSLPELSYDYGALEPHISGRIMELHHSKHHNTYVNGANTALEKLGRLAEPPMTKDAIAGRIRRLLAMADKRAKELGIPDTHEAVPADLRDRN